MDRKQLVVGPKSCERVPGVFALTHVPKYPLDELCTACPVKLREKHERAGNNVVCEVLTD